MTATSYPFDTGFIGWVATREIRRRLASLRRAAVGARYGLIGDVRTYHQVSALLR